MKKMKRRNLYIVILVLVGLCSSIGTVFAEDPSPWMIKSGTKLTYDVEFVVTELDVDTKGVFTVSIEKIFDNGTLVYSIKYDKSLEELQSRPTDVDSLSTLTKIPGFFSVSMVLNKEKYELLDYSGEFEEIQTYVDERNENGTNFTILGFSDEKSYNITYEGTNEEGVEIYRHEGKEYSEEGILQKDIFYVTLEEEDGTRVRKISVQLRGFSISGFHIEFLSIFMGLSVIALIIHSKRLD